MHLSHSIDLYIDNASALDSLLQKHGLQGAKLEPVGEDMAPRKYYRLIKEGQSYVLGVSPPDTHPDAHPGHLIISTVKLTELLHDHGIRVPKVYDYVCEEGFILLEDFGDLRMDIAIKEGHINEKEAYVLAAEVGDKIQGIAAVPGLKNYYDSHVHTGRTKLVEWYLPLLTKTSYNSQTSQDYAALWDALENRIAPQKMTFSHVDFHLMNFMYLPEEQGTAKCGVLDFQGAMRGSYAYDLVNLLGDARRLVPEDIKKAALKRFMQDMDEETQANFANHYAILSAQFHSRCLGQFIELAYKGKQQYLQYIPDLLIQFRQDVDVQLLKPIKEWLLDQGMVLDQPLILDQLSLDDGKGYIEKLLT